MNRRELVALLFFLDRLPPSSARWRAEAIVLDALLEHDAEECAAPAESGVFPVG